MLVVAFKVQDSVPDLRLRPLGVVVRRGPHTPELQPHNYLMVGHGAAKDSKGGSGGTHHHRVLQFARRPLRFGGTIRSQPEGGVLRLEVENMHRLWARHPLHRAPRHDAIGLHPAAIRSSESHGRSRCQVIVANLP